MLVKVRIKRLGQSTEGPWVLVEWDIENCAFMGTRFLSCKKHDPKWKVGDTIEVPKTLLK